MDLGRQALINTIMQLMAQYEDDTGKMFGDEHGELETAIFAAIDSKSVSRLCMVITQIEREALNETLKNW